MNPFSMLLQYIFPLLNVALLFMLRSLFFCHGVSYHHTYVYFALSILFYMIDTTSLKGQCHEMVVEVRPWSGRLGLN
jgi:hypothetical protein